MGYGVMLLSGILLLIVYILIATEKIPRVTIAILGAGITLALGLIPTKHAFSHIDFGVIFLLVSMMMIVHITKKSGIFKWLAIELLKLSKGSPKLSLVFLAIFTAVASAFLDNVTTVILVLPITFVVAGEFDISPIPFLITEVMASNIGGAATLIGDPPNIIIASAAGLSFMDFVRELTPVIVVIFLVCMCVLMYMFRNDLVSTPERMKQVANLDNSTSIKNKPLMIRSLIVLTLVVVGFIMHGMIHIEAYTIAVLGAGVLLLSEKPKQILHEVEWTTIFFFIGLFIIIGGLVETGGIKFLADKLIYLTKGDLKITSMVVLWASGILSAIVDNIPYTITMAPLIQELHGVVNLEPLWWSLSLGACLGGNATIIGAAANVIVAETAQAAGCAISFFKFMKYGVLVSVISLVISSIYLYFRFLAG